MNATRLSISVLSMSSLLGVYAVAQDKKKADTTQRETVARPMTEKERKKREDKLRKELETPYRKWLNEDVAYIITDEERTAFKRLQTDEEREQFIEQFWLRRDPTPDTDRKRVQGRALPPHRLRQRALRLRHPRLEDRPRPHLHHLRSARRNRDRIPPAAPMSGRPKKAAAPPPPIPFEQWRYRYIEGIGTDIIIEFVDPTMTGEYRMTMDPSEKDALLYVPGAGLTLMEQMGLATRRTASTARTAPTWAPAFGGRCRRR